MNTNVWKVILFVSLGVLIVFVTLNTSSETVVIRLGMQNSASKHSLSILLPETSRIIDLQKVNAIRAVSGHPKISRVYNPPPTDITTFNYNVRKDVVIPESDADRQKFAELFAQFEVHADWKSEDRKDHSSVLRTLNAATLTECMQACLNSSECVAITRLVPTCTLLRVGLTPWYAKGYVTLRRLPAATEKTVPVPPKNPNSLGDGVLFAVVSSTERIEQLSQQIHTWMQYTNAIIFLEPSERNSSDVHAMTALLSVFLKRFPQHKPVFLQKPDAVTEAEGNGWIDQEIIRYLHREQLIDNIDFLVLTDDDTYFFTQNMRLWLNWHRGNTAPLFASGNFGDNKGGTVLSKSALHMVADALVQDRTICTATRNYTIAAERIRVCAQNLKISESRTMGLTKEDWFVALQPNSKAWTAPFPLSSGSLPRVCAFNLQRYLDALDVPSEVPLEWGDYDVEAMRLWSLGDEFRTKAVQKGPDEKKNTWKIPQRSYFSWGSTQVRWSDLVAS